VLIGHARIIGMPMFPVNSHAYVSCV
jgi:hypothetical protein